MKVWNALISCLLLAIPVSIDALESLGPKEIIERGSNVVWKKLPFKQNMLSMGFIYGKLDSFIADPQPDMPIRIVTDKLYLPNNFYTDLNGCTVSGKIHRVTEYSKKRFEIRITDIECLNQGGRQRYPITGFVNGKDNFHGLTMDDFYDYKASKVYIFLLPRDFYDRNKSGTD